MYSHALRIHEIHFVHQSLFFFFSSKALRHLLLVHLNRVQLVLVSSFLWLSLLAPPRLIAVWLAISRRVTTCYCPFHCSPGHDYIGFDECLNYENDTIIQLILDLSNSDTVNFRWNEFLLETNNTGVFVWFPIDSMEKNMLKMNHVTGLFRPDQQNEDSTQWWGVQANKRKQNEKEKKR